MYWEQSRAVRLSPPLISVPDGEGGSYPVRFSNYPVMTIEVDIVRLLRTELDAMLRRAGLMAPLAAPPSPSPPPSLDQRGSFKVPQRGTLQAKVFEAAVVNNSARLYDDGLAEKLLKEFGYDKGGNSYSRTYKTTSNYIGELRRAVREGRLDLSHYSKT